MKTIVAIDADKNACATFAANFPETHVLNRRVVDCISMLPSADIVTGGFPCQPHSVAGKRLASKDERDGGDDFVESVRKVQCRQFMGENVPGILTSENGIYVQRLLDKMQNAGYVVEIRTLCASAYGVPQFRRRVWFWGIRKDLYGGGMRHCWPRPTHAWPWPEPGMFGNHGLARAITVGWALNIPHRQVDGVWFSGVNYADVEVFEVQGRVSNAEQVGSLGHRGATGRKNSMSSMLDETQITGIRRIRGSGVERRGHEIGEPAPTVMAPTGGKSGLCKVIAYRCLGEPAPTIIGGSKDSHTNGLSVVNDKRWRKEFGLVEIVDDPKHQPHQPHQPASTLNSGGDGHGMSGATGCLEVDTKQPRTSTPVSTPVSTLGIDSRHRLTAGKKTVRRLTVAEVQRLQSMPDDFIWPSNVSKTARYKVIGNGQASLMTHHLSQAMRQADPESETVIDLYCGGGVGACGMHGRYWEFNPSRVSCRARGASEAEIRQAGEAARSVMIENRQAKESRRG